MLLAHGCCACWEGHALGSSLCSPSTSAVSLVALRVRLAATTMLRSLLLLLQVLALPEKIFRHGAAQGRAPMRTDTCSSCMAGNVLAHGTVFERNRVKNGWRKP